MTHYGERLEIITKEFKERIEFFKSMGLYDDIVLDVSDFMPFIKQRARREVLNKNGKIKISLKVQINEVVTSAIRVVLNNKNNFCKDCKYFKGGLCSNPDNGVMNDASFFSVDENFGCNRFERRKDERN